MTLQISGASPRLKARIAGIFYVITVLTGAFGLSAGNASHLGHLANLVAGAAYLVVTALLYDLLKPVSRNLSMLAAFFSLVGVASGNDGFFFFGFYCLLLGFLIFRSSFFPQIIGVLMGLAGLGLLTGTMAKLLSPAFAHSLSYVPAILDGVGEISLTLWLLAFGVNVHRWHERASATAALQTA